MVRVCPPPILPGAPQETGREFVGLWRPRRDGQGDGPEASHKYSLGPNCPRTVPIWGLLGLAVAGSRPQLQLPSCSRQEISWQKAGAGTEGSWRLTGGGTQRKEKRPGRGRGVYANGSSHYPAFNEGRSRSWRKGPGDRVGGSQASPDKAGSLSVHCRDSSTPRGAQKPGPRDQVQKDG